jgi:predicted nucleic acid-binding protein
VLHRSIGLLSAHPQLGVRDAVHAATALHNDIERILTADRVFDGIPGITRVDPTSITTT